MANSTAPAVVSASVAGSFASAKEYAFSGSSAMPVPNARTPKPSQIQLTSGLSTICRLAD